MNYIVIDFEFNQYYDFSKKGEVPIGKKDEICPFEIIQIGAVKLDENFEMCENGSFSTLIRPTIYERVHPHVKKLTQITEESFEEYPTFDMVASDFAEFCGTDSVFVVWGNNDIVSLYRNMLYHNKLYIPMSTAYINLQKYVSKDLTNISNYQIGLKNALIKLDIDFSENFHDAYYDALYTSKILIHYKDRKLPIQYFQTKTIIKKKQSNRKIKSNELFILIEKKLGRKLSGQEKEVFFDVYNLGKNKEFN